MASNSTLDKNIHIIASREVVGSFTESAVFFRILFVLLLRIGFILMQIGSIPTENAHRILFQNILDIGVSLTSYGFLGFTLNFGSKSLEGVLGYGAWIDHDMNQISLHQAGYGFAAVLVGSGIITSVLSTRIHLLATTIISFFYSAVLYPIVAHWLWVDHGWMQVNKTIIKDYAGGLAVHTTASTFASVGAIVLGRRLLRLSDISEISVVGVEVSKNTIAGYMFVIIGFIAFSLPTPEEEFRLNYNKFNGVLFTNSVMSLSAAGLVTILLDVITNYKKAFTYWSILKYLQAAIGGLVALSCGVDTFSPFASFLVGLVAGMLFFFTAALVSISFIEDNCNIVASSFICSFLASLLSQMISKNTIIIHLKNFTWQMSCHLIIFVTSFAFATVIILLLYASNRLKTKREKINHERATATYKMNKRPSYKKLFSVSSSAGYLEPGLSNKAITNNENSAGEGNVASKNVKPKTSHVEESNESIITQISSSDTDFVISKRNSKIINLQESTSKTKKSHL